MMDEAYDIKILRDGSWLYQGTPIRRPELVRLFSTVLKRDAAGDYWLITPAERGRIAVEDAPFLAVSMTVLRGGQRQSVVFHTNLGDAVTLSDQNPLLLRGGIPYILVRDNLEARVARPVYYEMAALATLSPGHENKMGIWSQESFFVLE